MQHNSLRLYIDIAKTLMEYGSLNVNALSSFLKVNPSSLKERLTFLINQKLIKEKGRNTNTTYIITQRGTDLLKFFNVQPLIKVKIDKN